jgi:periplasmic protein TonB
METLLKPTLDDIVFMHRHQAYGAYDLRKSYPAILRKALIIGSVVFVALFLLPMLFRYLNPEPQLMMHEFNSELIFIPPVEKQPAPVVPPVEEPMVNTVKNLVPEVKIDEEVVEETPPPPIGAFDNAVSGLETAQGTTDEPAIEAPADNAPLNAEAEAVEIKPEETLSIGSVEIQPQFVGGMSELAAYLSKNLRYPRAATQAGVQGRVFVQFVVLTDGSIADVTVLKGIGFGCDEEAARVIKAMPKWKPGVQSGRAVRVRFNLPIAFLLQD